MNRIEAVAVENSTLFHNLDFILIDSVIEFSRADTLTRVRHIRASKNSQSTIQAIQNLSLYDTLNVKNEETTEPPIAVGKKKKREAWLCPLIRRLRFVFFWMFFLIFVAIEKKYLSLRR